MSIDKIPVIGVLSKKVSAITLNLVLLGVVCVVLGILVLVFPKVLDILVAMLLVLMGLIFFNIAHHIHSQKKKYLEFLGD